MIVSRAISIQAAALLVGASFALAPSVRAEQASLAEAAQNPIAAMISLPFQNNTFFETGPDNDTANVLNVQPVVPLSLSKDWNLITRTIVPLVYLPSTTDSLADVPNSHDHGDSFGLGDINASAFVSPVSSGKYTWGFGPSISFDSATSDRLGSGKWSAGPTAVGLVTDKPWVAGALARQIWSFAGDSDRKSVSQFLIQPFVNYNLPGGWYLVSAPIITANWQASSDDTWLVPVGGGFGRVFPIGAQPVNAGLQAYYNVEKPTFGPQWSLRAVLTFLFPK
jgi:hypothetical protein